MGFCVIIIRSILYLILAMCALRIYWLEPAAEDSLLGQIKIPAARISVGYLSNPRERELLGQESYQEKLADGILAALAKSCEELGDLRSVRAGEAYVR